MAVRWRCSTTSITAVMTTAMISSVPHRRRVPSERARMGMGLMGSPGGGVQPDLAHGNVGIAQAVDLDAAHVRLEDALVGLVPDREHRRVVHDQLLGAPVQIHAS